jgi:hypothetical protein
MLMGTVTIFASGNKAEIKNVHKEIGKSMVDAVRAIISQPAPTTIRRRPSRLLPHVRTAGTFSNNSASSENRVTPAS